MVWRVFHVPNEVMSQNLNEHRHPLLPTVQANLDRIRALPASEREEEYMDMFGPYGRPVESYLVAAVFAAELTPVDLAYMVLLQWGPTEEEMDKALGTPSAPVRSKLERLRVI